MIADKGCTNDKFFGEYVPHTLRSIGAKKPFNQVNLRLVVMGRGTNLDTVAANDSNLQKNRRNLCGKTKGVVEAAGFDGPTRSGREPSPDCMVNLTITVNAD